MFDKKNKKELQRISWLVLLVISFSSLLYFNSRLGWFSEVLHASIELGTIKLSLYLAIKAIFTGLFFFWFSSFLLENGEQKIMKLRGMKHSNRTLIYKAFQISIYAVLFLVFLDIIGVNLTAFAVVGGALGIGIGFGMQKITSNFISGLIILFEKSIENGHLIELESGILGFVRKIGARYTLVETFENREILIPNEDIITSKLTNWTFTNTLARTSIDVGVAYGSDLRLVERLILLAATSHEKIAKDPKPLCFLMEFGDNSINFRLLFWVLDVIDGRMRPKSDVMFAIDDAFKTHNVEIPFPQRDIYVKNFKELRK